MRLLQISFGLSVNLDEIQVVRLISETETEVVLGGENYLTGIPYDTLIALIHSKVEAPEGIIQTSVKSETALEQLAKFQATPTP